MKKFLIEMAAYHYWANQRLLQTLKGLPEELLDKEVPGSFPTLRSTFYHLWDAEAIWYQRLKLVEQPVRVSVGFQDTFDTFAEKFLHQNKLLEEWMQKISEPLLDHVFSYYNTKKEFYKIPVYVGLMQVFNHGTYHRGQIVTMLHELGITKIPATDFSLFSSGKK